MIHILLLVLKIIGIILLVILLAAIAVIMAVLFVPVRYNLTAEYYDNKPDVKFNVSWLLHLFRINGLYNKNDGFLMKVKILFFTLYPKNKKTDADDKSLKLSDAWFEAVCVQTGERTVFVTGEDGIALSPELPIGYLKNGAWSMYEYEVQEILAPPGYGHSGETVSVVFDREKENLIQLYEVSIENKKTKVQLSKLDIATGEELPGASLELKTIDGTIIDSWISGKTPHFVEGTLTAGETYILTEISAPDGYRGSYPVYSTEGRQLYQNRDDGPKENTGKTGRPH